VYYIISVSEAVPQPITTKVNKLLTVQIDGSQTLF